MPENNLGIPNPREEQKRDPAICRAKRTHANLVECLVKNPSHCRYALRYGSGIYCTHPEQNEIAARTEAEKNKPK